MSELFIPIAGRQVAARIQGAQRAHGTVIFVHGSGVDRHDPRSEFVAGKLRQAGWSTVLFDLLEPQEALDCHNVFDIDLQVQRLEVALERLRDKRRLHEPLGYFATGVGAGVVLLAAAKHPEHVAAIVARSGRPDTALFWLPRVQAPTLLIVEQPDDCNRRALEQLTVDKELAVVPSASHFFREPEALSAVAQHALRWFSRYLAKPVPGDSSAQPPSRPAQPGPPAAR
jgi:putative phosphoribosyl transferase